MNSERPSCAHTYILVGPSNNYTTLYALALMFAYMQIKVCLCTGLYCGMYTQCCTYYRYVYMYNYTALWLCLQMRPLILTLRLQMPCPHVTMVQLLPVLHKKISWRFKFSANWRATATYVGMVVE